VKTRLVNDVPDLAQRIHNGILTLVNDEYCRQQHCKQHGGSEKSGNDSMHG
jgi:hypothetical protein